MVGTGEAGSVCVVATVAPPRGLKRPSVGPTAPALQAAEPCDRRHGQPGLPDKRGVRLTISRAFKRGRRLPALASRPIVGGCRGERRRSPLLLNSLPPTST